jgi:cytochrome c-type biogenesis protein
MEIPFAFAFTAGLVATLNPCGFAMLPAYLSYFMGLDETDGHPTSAAVSGLRALQVGGIVSLGFLTVFGLAGVLITLGVQAIVEAMPFIAMAVGVGVVALGIAMLSGRELRVRLPRASKAPAGRRTGGVFAFGVSYAIASLSCTLPVFLVVVAGTIPQLGFVAGVATFLIYGLGMSVLLVVVTVALAFGKQALVTRLRRGSAHVNRIAGGILVLAGGYIVFFWVATLNSEVGTQPAAVAWVEQLSSRVTNLVADAPVAIGTGAIAVIAIVGVGSFIAARRATAGQHLIVEPQPSAGSHPTDDVVEPSSTRSDGA